MIHNGLTAYGDSEISEDQLPGRQFPISVSAAPHTSGGFQDVGSLEFCIIFLTGPTGTPYRALVNAHCVFEYEIL
jgi:hypothetical protein